jgi:glucose-1-phosphate thymidylyltransferase
LEENASTTGAVRIGRDTIVRSRTEIRGPVAIGQRCEIGPNSYIGPHTSIGNDVIIRNSEVENSIVMDGAHIDCGKRIVDSLIGSKANITSSEKNLPRGMKLILGDLTYVSV